MDPPTPCASGSDGSCRACSVLGHHTQFQPRRSVAAAIPSITMAAGLCFPASSESVRSVRIHSTTLVRLLHGLDLFPSGISGKSSESVRSVRIRSTTLVRLFHGLDLLQSGISGKMIISLDTITIIAMLVVSFLSLYRYLSPVA